MIGEKLNGFTIKSLISEEGGMAKVYYAENGIGKKAAIKVLLPKFFWDEPVKQRFINEAKTMVKLEHDHICSVYDLVVTDSYAAILLEFMEGNDLSVLLDKRKKFSEDEVMEYLPQICSALAFAHEKGVVHRDIKPSNLFLHNGKIKLMDFGIAMVKSEAGGRMTQTGTRMGSISYMSPEQIRSTKDVDRRTDIYSLGITIYQLLTGNLPYTLGKTDTDFAIMEKIVHENPKYIAGISSKMNKLIQKATAKETANRFLSVEYMLRYIDREASSPPNLNNVGKSSMDQKPVNKERENKKPTFLNNDNTLIEENSKNKKIEEYFKFILNTDKIWVYCNKGHKGLHRDGNKLKCKECSWEYLVDDKTVNNDNIPGNYVHWISEKEGFFTDIETKLKYAVVKIGYQVWFAENYYTEKQYIGSFTGQPFRLLKVLNNCPAGTKVPSDEDWLVLEKKIGISEKDLYSTSYFTAARGTLAVNKLLDPRVGYNLTFTNKVFGLPCTWLWSSTVIGKKVWIRYIHGSLIDRSKYGLNNDFYVRLILK